jgi:probable metal-binding protein
MNQIHGHEVLKMMLESGKTYTKPGLVAEIIAKFGPEARFHTCSAENLTAAELVAFLDSKGKLVAQPGGVQTSADLMCGH